MSTRILIWSCIGVAAAGFLLAQEQQPPRQDADPPGRVARLNFLTGTVSFRPGSQEDWGPATMNYPLTTGDHLWTDQQGGAEMHIGSTAVRLAGGTLFSVLNIDDHNGQISVSQGYMNVRLPRMDEGDTFEVDTPNGAVSLLGPGDYRVDVNPDANLMTVTVRAGAAEVNGGGQTFAVNEGQHVRFSGSDQLNAETLQAPALDQWDEWCIGRDRRDEEAVKQVAQYVGNEMIGAEDLVDNGQWRTDPTYGAYWTPTHVAADWAPYRYGHWAYVEPWGWSWIDDAQWGFAPFHYGRWANIGGGWGWVPGPVVARPVYAPALVAFVGGGNFGVSVGSGPVAAWVPLGPYEAYHPYYRVSNVYVERVNVSYGRYLGVREVTYVNRPYVTCVRQDVFVGARPVYAGFVHVPAGARFERVDVVSYRPAREAYYGRRFEGARFVAPPRAAFARPVVVSHAPVFRSGYRPAIAYRAAPVPTRRYEVVGGHGPYQPVNTGRVSYAGPYRGNGGVPNYGHPGGNPGPYRGNERQTNYGAAGQPNVGNRGGTPEVYRGNTGRPNYGNGRPNDAGQPYGNRGYAGQPNSGNSGIQYGNRGNTGQQYGNRPNAAQPNTENQRVTGQPNYGANPGGRQPPNYGAGQGNPGVRQTPNYGRQPSEQRTPNWQQHQQQQVHQQQPRQVQQQPPQQRQPQVQQAPKRDANPEHRR